MPKLSLSVRVAAASIVFLSVIHIIFWASLALAARLRLWREHTDGDIPDDQLLDADSGITALRSSADRLEAWHDGGRRGPRPPGRLRPHRPESLNVLRRAWSMPLYRTVYDPDGRPRDLRRAGRW